MTQPAAIHTIRRIVASSDDAEAAVCLAVLDAILAGGDPRDALGLRCAPGQRSVATREKLRRRDELIRDLAQRHYRDLCPAAQARAIIGEWTAYNRAAAFRDANLPDMPSGYAGKPRAAMFEISKAGLNIPAKRQLLEILSAQKNAVSYPYSLHSTSPILSLTHERNDSDPDEKS